MADPIWSEDDLSLVPDPDLGKLELRRGEDLLASFDELRAAKMAQAIVRWAGGASLEEVWFQVFYVHEATDMEGDVLDLPQLGEPREDWEYTWDVADIAGTREKVSDIGNLVSSKSRDDDDAARAWISIFRMPDDVRVWRGYWDEFDDVPDDDLLQD